MDIDKLNKEEISQLVMELIQKLNQSETNHLLYKIAKNKEIIIFNTMWKELYEEYRNDENIKYWDYDSIVYKMSKSVYDESPDIIATVLEILSDEYESDEESETDNDSDDENQ